MKILIWVGWLVVASILNTILGLATGFRLGYVLFYLVVWFPAKQMCRKWDEYKDNKKAKAYYAKKNSAPAEASQPGEQRLPPQPSVQMQAGSNQWKCSCGRIHANYESSCVCGVTKRDAMNGSAPNHAALQTAQAASAAPRETTAPPRFCMQCGNKLLPNSRFCNKCGAEIKQHQ